MKIQFLAAFVMPAMLLAQGPPPGPPKPPSTAKAAAPVDLTGYWVSVVTEDWRWRMVTPLKGDFASVPINDRAKREGEAWDPAKDEAAGLQCKAYGAPALMRIPGRVHITWQDDNTLKVETDAGTQTRVFRFGAPGVAPPATTTEARSWQGYSVANWERPAIGLEPPAAFAVFSSRVADKGRSLEVVTNNLRAGYLRKNGLPYSETAIVREYYDYHKEPNNDEWFTVTTVVNDPVYLRGSFITSTDFKKQPNANGWRPAACTVK